VVRVGSPRCGATPIDRGIPGTVAKGVPADLTDAGDVPIRFRATSDTQYVTSLARPVIAHDSGPGGNVVDVTHVLPVDTPPDSAVHAVAV
jgi:hypothetical protein